MGEKRSSRGKTQEKNPPQTPLKASRPQGVVQHSRGGTQISRHTREFCASLALIVTPSAPIAREVLLVGGGHSHALVLRMWAMRPVPGVRLTLVSDVSHAPYSGMLPGHLAGFYSWDEIHIDLRRLCEFAGATFLHARATGLDLAAKRVLLDGRPAHGFDLVSLNTGSTPAAPGIEGAADHAVPAKPVPQFLAAWERIVTDSAGKEPRLVVIGGGAGGVELALSCQQRLQRRCHVTIIHRGAGVMTGHNDGVRKILTRLLAERGISVLSGKRVTAVRDGSVMTSDGTVVPADHVFRVTNAAPPGWIRESGLACDDAGFALVADTLCSTSHPFVFAAGDCATIATAPRPKSGVFAVRAARHLIENLRRALLDQPLQPWQPQKNFLSLIGTADHAAVASRAHLAWHSPRLWTLKDWIDRRFMRKFSDLPQQPMRLEKPAASPAAQPDGLADLQRRAAMRCLGCAAKVGPAILRDTMARLRAENPDAFSSGDASLLAGLDQPDDAAVFLTPAGQALVQTVDYMPALVSDPWLFGRIATLHCFSDLFAMGATPHSCLAAALLPFAAESVTAETLFQLLSGVLHELKSLNARLLGGHTAEGAVLGLALTCNGLADPARLLRKGLSVPPTEPLALILTKPLGTGALFAASMRLAVRGHWIDSALASMLMSNLPAAQILQAHGALACTDVTGFGLAGHLLEMLNASPPGCSVSLKLGALPAVPGAVDCLTAGHLSSLSPANSRAAAALDNAADFATHPHFPLLFDPQTSGGLLALVPASLAATCLRDLHTSGLDGASIIGELTHGDGLERRLQLVC